MTYKTFTETFNKTVELDCDTKAEFLLALRENNMKFDIQRIATAEQYDFILENTNAETENFRAMKYMHGEAPTIEQHCKNLDRLFWEDSARLKKHLAS